jgi:hypothetical protein
MLGKNIKGQLTHWPSIGKIAPNISVLKLVELPHSHITGITLCLRGTAEEIHNNTLKATLHWV